jgi:tRNA G37 N-methylase Trm5
MRHEQVSNFNLSRPASLISLTEGIELNKINLVIISLFGDFADVCFDGFKTL